MKVLYIIDSFAIGGAEKSLLDILQHAQNIEPVVCGLYCDGSLLVNYTQSGIKTFHFKIANRYGWQKLFSLLSKVVDEEKPLLVHSTLFRSNILARMLGKKYGIPIINSIVSDSYGEVRKSQMSFSRKLKLHFTLLLDRYTAKYATHFIANSEAIKMSNSKILGLDENKVSVIHRGRDGSSFIKERHREVADTRKKLGIDVADFLFLNVGRLIPSKGQLDLLKSMAKIIDNYPQVKLLIAGDGPYRVELQRCVDEYRLNDRVLLLGNRDDIPVLLKLAHAFVFPTYYEGHSGALVEAMFAGIPIIASDIPPNLETIDKSMATVVPLGDVDELRLAMLDCVENYNKYAEKAAKALTRALNRFEIKEVSRAYEDLYSEIIKECSK